MAYRSSSSVSLSSSSTAAPSVPSGTAQNDIIIVAIHTQSSPSITPPSGFSEITGWSTTIGGIYLRGYWKRAGSGESGTYSFSLGGTMSRSCVCAAYSGRITTGDPFDSDDVDVATTPDYGNFPPVAVTTTTNGCDLLYISTCGPDNGLIPPTTGGTWTERADSGSYGPIAIYDRTQSTAGSTGNVYAVETGWDLISALVALLPAGSSGNPYYYYAQQ